MTSTDVLRPVPLADVELGLSQFAIRRDLVRDYLVSLRTDDLLRHHRFESGGWMPPSTLDGAHGGWEAPTSQVRGHFSGHWISAAARIAASTGHAELRGRVEFCIDELARCQARNGNGWVFPIPERYLQLIAKGEPVWAPIYITHKTLMGLWDAYALLGIDKALDVMAQAAGWYTRFTDGMTPEGLDDFLDNEAGGILETFADLYGATGAPEHRELVRRFDRRRLFDPLLAGRDVLTNRHANTTIPEVLGAARAWEVTGEDRYREVVEAYWRSAVTERGCYATGGQTSGEIWTAPMQLSTRLSRTNQEHCVVYNMMRLARTLLRWTGDPTYADYLERNYYNGILAQQHPATGMVDYYLGLAPGSKKSWATPRDSFPCCQGTMVQAGSLHGTDSFYATDDGLALVVHQPARLAWSWDGTPVRVSVTTPEESVSPGVMRFDGDIDAHRPDDHTVTVTIDADRDVDFTLRLRVPWWATGGGKLAVDGEPAGTHAAGTFVDLKRSWSRSTVTLDLPRSIVEEPLPGSDRLRAFVDGPVVLAGLTAGDVPVDGVMEPIDEREWNRWTGRYRSGGVSFLPLHDVVDEAYTVYFPRP